MICRLFLTAILSTGLAQGGAEEKPPKAKKPEAVFDAGLETAKVLAYKSLPGGDLRMLEVDPPNHQLSASAPAVLFFFGGSWKRGQPSQFARQAHYFASRGVVAFCVDYRVEERQGTTPFECVADGKAAVRWVRSHAKELGVDPARIAVAGGSAGGHVAISTAILPALEEPDADRSIISVPNAVILFNPVVDTSKEGFGNAKLGSRWQEISPLHHVVPGLPPTTLFHGTADTTAPYLGAKRFAEAMRQAGNTCTLKSFEGRGHGFYVREGKAYTEVIEDTDRFLASLGWIQGEPTISQFAAPAPSSSTATE